MYEAFGMRIECDKKPSVLLAHVYIVKR